MIYVAKAMTGEIARRVISDSSSSRLPIALIFENAWQEQEFPEGLAYDVDADSYLVLVPFSLRDPRSNGDYAFFCEGKMHHVMFVAPSHTTIRIRNGASADFLPSCDFMNRLTTAFATHHAVIRVIDGVPTPRGGLIVPTIGPRDSK